MAQLQSADELLEQALLALYRQWPHLPRRTTLPALDRLRRALADELETMLAAPDQERFRSAASKFAQEALRLPFVRSAAGAELEALAALSPGAWRPSGLRGLPLLRTTPLNAERLQALILLLRAEDPPASAVQRWHYVVDETPAAWADLRGAAEDVLGRMPPSARQALEAIDAHLQAALQDSSCNALAAYEEALRQLEAVPGLAAALSDHFLRWKTPQRIVRRSAGATILKEPALAAPEMSGAESEAFAPPTGAEEAPSAPPGEPFQVNFHTEVRFPASVRRWEVNWLIVRLRLQAPAATVAAGVVPVEFSVQGAEAPPPETLTVRVLAPEFEEETHCWERTITVHHDRDSDPAVFLLKGDELGKKRIAIDFYHKGRLVGGVSFMTEVTQAPTVGVNVEIARSDGAPEFARLERNPPPPADLHLRVVKKAQENTLAFWLDSPKPEVPYRWTFMGETPLTSDDPLAFLIQELAPINEMVRVLAGELTEEERADAELRLATLAEGLFEQLLPETFRAEYFARIVPLREAGLIQSFLITSDEPWIPWELLKPYHWDASEGKEHVDDFWATRFRLSRWLAGRGPLVRMAVNVAALVMPEVGLAAVDAERAFFDQLAAQRNVRLEGPTQRRKEVLDLLMTGGYQVMHIATHGQFNPEDADRSAIELADEPLYPADLRGSLLRGIRRSTPLVFLNACDGGRANFGLTGLGGWADKLFKEANAAAFVGALWEVHDALAGEFSKTFYSRLAEGATLGEAMQAARLHVREIDPLNPTWLAYTLYGDPNATVQIGASGD
ncbi:MAG: CHAT domain-containing protein [Caldilinea sp.]|nr:CHAT domain-containing protein [Caldilinea sp.]MDW8440121.1 CHAT domain-containing protein [Caldilineaceae bacterium]